MNKFTVPDIVENDNSGPIIEGRVVPAKFGNHHFHPILFTNLS